MTKKHDRHHDHCEHDLEHCGKCDVAYCAKCSKEWGAECKMSHSPYWYTSPTITTGGTASDFPGANTTYTCAHSN